MESTTTSLQAVPRDPKITIATARDGELTTVANAVHDMVPVRTNHNKAIVECVVLNRTLLFD